MNPNVVLAAALAFLAGLALAYVLTTARYERLIAPPSAAPTVITPVYKVMT